MKYILKRCLERVIENKKCLLKIFYRFIMVLICKKIFFSHHSQLTEVKLHINTLLYYAFVH